MDREVGFEPIDIIPWISILHTSTDLVPAQPRWHTPAYYYLSLDLNFLAAASRFFLAAAAAAFLFFVSAAV